MIKTTEGKIIGGFSDCKLETKKPNDIYSETFIFDLNEYNIKKCKNKKFSLNYGHRFLSFGFIKLMRNNGKKIEFAEFVIDLEKKYGTSLFPSSKISPFIFHKDSNKSSIYSNDDDTNLYFYRINEIEFLAKSNKYN